MKNGAAIAAAQLVLILPAALFMLALVARYFGTLDAEPAHTAEQIVTWYSQRLWTLWLLLIALPLGAFVTGWAMLLGARGPEPAPPLRSRPATAMIGAVTVAAGAILVVVALHMLAN